MSDAAANTVADAGHGHNHHNPHLAHHFDTPQQQYASAKLGMWVFLGTEILMFGGLFCAYSVYRHNHPDVFDYAHRALNPVLGGINTAVLIASSLTMAMAVRYSQLGKKIPLVVCLFATLLGGAGFMVIKTIEYKTKWEHHLFPGSMNVFNKEFKGDAKPPNDIAAADHGDASHGSEHSPAAHATTGEAHAGMAMAATSAPATAPAISHNPYDDPLAGTPDAPKIVAAFVAPEGLAPAVAHADHHLYLSDLSALDRDRVNTFFSVYFLMTGLHGFHVLVGMGLMIWILLRAAKNEFGPQYFTPVDLVGLYWHLVDLIWIFLFPLLYLIH